MVEWISNLKVGDKVFKQSGLTLSPATVIKVTEKQVQISYKGAWSDWASTGYFRKEDGKSVIGRGDDKSFLVQFTHLNEILYIEMIEYYELKKWLIDTKFSLEDLRVFHSYISFKESNRVD